MENILLGTIDWATQHYWVVLAVSIFLVWSCKNDPRGQFFQYYCKKIVYGALGAVALLMHYQLKSVWLLLLLTAGLITMVGFVQEFIFGMFCDEEYDD